MSIREKLQDTASYLRFTRKAILGRGGEIAENAGLKEIADAVYKIPADTSLVYQTDESVAYHKIVPTNAEEYAQVERVGGMTYKTENLIPFPFDYDVGYVKELSGVKFTILDDGAISVVGTPTSTGLFTFISDDVTNLTNVCQDGKQYTISGGKTGILVVAHKTPIDGAIQSSGWLEAGSTGQATGVMPEGYRLYRVAIYIGSAAVGTAINTVIYPMLNEGSTALPYSPYFEGLRDTKVTEMRSEHGNLFNYDNVHESLKGTGENEGKIVFNLVAYYHNIFTGKVGSSTIPTKDMWNKFMYLSKGTYYVYFDMETTEADESKKDLEARSFIIQNGEWTNFWCGSNGQSIPNGGTFTMYGDGYCYLRKHNNIKAIVSNLMVTRTPRTEYVPYNPSILDIPENLRNFLEQHGYGRGIEGYPNYIDFERKVFVQNTYRKVFDGTEAWTARSTTNGKMRVSTQLDADAIFSSAATVSPFVCNLYQSVSASNTWNEIVGVCFNSAKEIMVYDDNYNTSDVSLWKAHLAELYANGNPLIVEYALAEPIEVDISAYLKDDITFLQVEGGGTITAVNEHQYDAPSTIKYMTKVGN